MSDDEILSLHSELDPSGDFREAAHAPAAPQLEQSVGATARAELANKAEETLALDRHEMAWVREQERLSGKAQMLPGFDLGARQTRDLKSEYEARHAAWTEQGGQIREHYRMRHTQIRVNGQTVKDEFTESSSTSGPESDLAKAFKTSSPTMPEGPNALADAQPLQPTQQIAASRGRSR